MRGRPAILGGASIRGHKPWPAWPQWDESERELLLAALDSGRWSSSAGGGIATQWAAEFAAAQGGLHGIAVTNGTQALEAALIACGVGEGDEVIVPALTFVATATAVLAVNAVPIVVDVDPRSLTIDPVAVAAAINERTRAVIPVHLAGVAADLDALGELCRRHDLALVEDAAHAHGSRWNDRGLGTFGEFGCFSFEAHKLITAGEGGALLTDSEELRAAAASYVNCGRVEGEHWYHHPNYGDNLRMSEAAAAILTAQLRRFPAQHALRGERAALLDEALAGFPGIELQAADPRMTNRSRYAYVFRYDAAEFSDLAAADFRAALAAEGVETGVCYPPIHTLGLFRERRFGARMRSTAPPVDYAALRLPVAEAAAEDSVWLSHQMLLADPEDALDIARAVERIHDHAAAIAGATPEPGRFTKALRTLRQYG